jgi:dienelactone hydrolase
VQRFLTQTDCINHNKRLIWSNANETGDYDIIADFGNDTADPMAFVPNNSFDQPLDLVDGKFVAGFRVVADPGTATNPNILHAGSYEYNQATQGTVTVSDPQGDYTTQPTLNLVAEIRFPADNPGVSEPAQISNAQADYPLLVCVHGNGHNYKNYTYLLDHWAKNGFIAASIHLDSGMAGEGRASVLFKHIDILKGLFAGHIQNKIGIMGHSRGGEGVVSAARMNQQQVLGHGIKAIISLGPTDQYTKETLAGSWATPYLVMHGAMDGDVATPGKMGFSLYDRANGEPKSMLWLYGANHNRFNLINPDADYNSYKIDDVKDHPKIMTQPSHMATAKACMTAFFRWQLYGAAEYEGIFKGEWIPASVAQAEPALNRIYVQYGDKVTKVVDNFEQMPHDWQASTIAGSVGDAGTLPAPPQEDQLAGLDTHSPHDTSGLLLRWNAIGDRLVYTPSAPINAGAYSAISFRVAQRVGSMENPAGQVQDFYLTMKDTGNHSRSIRVHAFGEIPPQQERGKSQYTLTALSTIRIPLHVYQTEVVNTDKVNVAQIQSISFDFQAKMKGEIEIDSVEFAN